MGNPLLPFFYYLTAYSLGIAVLVSLAVRLRIQKNTDASHFFIVTLTMTVTVLVSTLQNYLQGPAGSAGSTLLTGINYLTAAFFTVTTVRFFHLLYPWRGTGIVNGITLFTASILILLTGINLIHPFWKPVPDLLLGFKNLAILYTAVLGMICFSRKERTRPHRFARIIIPVSLPCIPLFFVTELPVLRSAGPQWLSGISLKGPWILPGIYIIWCLAWLISGKGRHKPAASSPPEAFCRQYGISPREREVMIRLVRGNSYREIMAALFISLPTVKTHISNLYRKTGTSNRLELAVKAGLIPSTDEIHTDG
jgi:DNA-binding CsgD family transcriptional regulator